MRAYERALRFTLEHPLALALFTVLLIGGSYFCYTHTGSDLLPAMDEGGFISTTSCRPDHRFEETNRVINHVEQILRATPGGGKHLAPHRPAAGPGRRYRSQHRRSHQSG